MIKNLPANAGGVGSIPGLGRSLREGNKCQPIPVFLPGKSHGQKSLMGCSPWGQKELDTTEQQQQLGNGDPLRAAITRRRRKR